jgi:hypothetical protein
VPAGTARCGKGGPVLLLACRGRLACGVVLRCGGRAGQILAGNPDGGQRDQQGEQRDCGREQEPRENPVASACAVSWAGEAAG